MEVSLYGWGSLGGVGRGMRWWGGAGRWRWWGGAGQWWDGAGRGGAGAGQGCGACGGAEAGQGGAGRWWDEVGYMGSGTGGVHGVGWGAARQAMFLYMSTSKYSKPQAQVESHAFLHLWGFEYSCVCTH